MKKIILILAIATLIGCNKDDDNISSPAIPVTENVSQYVGFWVFNSQTCQNKEIRIKIGSSNDELIFDGISGNVVNKVLTASNPFSTWVVSFNDDSFATVDYNYGLCTGNLSKTR